MKIVSFRTYFYIIYFTFHHISIKDISINRIHFVSDNLANTHTSNSLNRKSEKLWTSKNSNWIYLFIK